MSKLFPKTKLNKFKELFLEKQATLLGQAKVGVECDGGDEVDLVQSKLINDMLEALTQRDKLTLRKISDALRKIEDGSFGLCEECEEPIPEKRLIAVPGCATCIGCAEQQELYIKQYRQG